MKSEFFILEHPSDIGIEARGASLAEAFAAAAKGLMSVIVDASTVEAKKKRSVSIQASDRGQLLVRWLQEILYLYDGQKFISKEFSVRDLTATSLTAEVRGEVFSLSRHRTLMDVKAVTYHQLAVGTDTEGDYVRVFLDI